LQYYTLDDCYRNFDTGLVGKGLQGVFQQYTQLTQALMLHRRAEAAAPGCAVEDVNVDIPKLVEDLAEKYLSIGFDRASAITLHMTVQALQLFTTINVVVTVASIVALLLFYFFVYLRLIRRLDAEIKNVRHLLLLFPDEISRVVPAIVAAGRELMKEGHTSSGSSTISM
jgi:hypothetical protein